MWFAIVGKRTPTDTTAFTRSPAAKPSPSKSSTWSSPIRYAARSSRATRPSFSSSPASVTWPPPSG